MSSIPTYRPAPGKLASAAEMNSLFTGVGSATSNINNDNVRSQAIDIGQIETVTANDLGRVTRFVGQYNDTSIPSFNDGVTTTVAQWNINSGVGAEYDIGSIARIYTSFRVGSITVGTAQYGGGSAAINATRIQRQQLFSGAGWLFWLEWDLTSNALSNFVPVPGQEDFGNHISGINDAAGNPVPHIRTKFTAATMLVPHVYASVNSSTSTGAILNPVNGQFCQPIRHGRAYHHKRTGTNGRIYGLRLRGRGVVSIGIDPAATGDGIFYVRDTVLWAGGGATWDDHSFNNESIDLTNASFRMLVQEAE